MKHFSHMTIYTPLSTKNIYCIYMYNLNQYATALVSGVDFLLFFFLPSPSLQLIISLLSYSRFWIQRRTQLPTTLCFPPFSNIFCCVRLVIQQKLQQQNNKITLFLLLYPNTRAYSRPRGKAHAQPFFFDMAR